MIKKLLLILAAAIFLPGSALAQNAWVQVTAQQNVFTPTGLVVRAIPNATVTVCTSIGTGTPCTPLATIYTTSSGSTPAANPFTTDVNGNGGFWIAQGTQAVYSITAPNVTGQLFNVTSGGNSVPGGSTGQLQFNSSGALGGLSGSTVTPSTGAVTLGSTTATNFTGDASSTFSPTAQMFLPCSSGAFGGFIRQCISLLNPGTTATAALSVQTEDTSNSFGAYGMWVGAVNSGTGGGVGIEDTYYPNIPMGMELGADKADGIDIQADAIGAGTVDEINNLNIGCQNGGTGLVKVCRGIHIGLLGSGTITTREGIRVDSGNNIFTGTTAIQTPVLATGINGQTAPVIENLNSSSEPNLYGQLTVAGLGAGNDPSLGQPALIETSTEANTTFAWIARAHASNPSAYSAYRLQTGGGTSWTHFVYDGTNTWIEQTDPTNGQSWNVGTATLSPAGLFKSTSFAFVGGGPTITSFQGTDIKALTSGTISGTGAALCTDANGGATTTGCSASSTVTGGNAFGSSETFNAAACETSFGATTLSGASTTTGLTCLPANAIIDAVVYRITTTITTATSFTIGDSGSATRYCGTQSTLTAGTTGTCTAAGYYLNASALGVKITPSTSPGAGAIRLIVYYHTWTPPSS